jgi:transglutaminase-like putative cysteine protease
MIFRTILKRLFHVEEMIFVLSLMTLACLPIALSEIVRDAGLSLLLPLTMIGAILAWVLAVWGVQKSLSGFILLALGPLVLYIRIGQMGGSLFELVRQFVILIPALLNKLFYEVPPDYSILLLSWDVLVQKLLAFSGRLLLWLTGNFHGIQIEDPIVRTLIWCLVVWLIAVWAGWQIYRNKKFMLGMLPSTVLLAFILDYTGKDKTSLWFHLSLLLFLYGLTNFHNVQTRWNVSHIDYAESTSIDTLTLVGMLTFGLVCASFLVSTFSIRDVLDNFREKRAGSNESQAKSLGLESAKDNFRVTGFQNGLPRSYLLSAGPEISTQLAMTISTGDLPPMSRNAHPIVPRYYWRTLTYSFYTGGGWTNPSVSAEDIFSDQPLIEESNPNYRIVQQKVVIANNTSDRLYWTGVLVHADVPFKAAWSHKAKDDSPLDNDLLAALAPAEVYSAESIVLNVSADDLRESPSVYPAWVRRQFLALPDSVPEHVLALARDLTASESNAYDRALAIQNYLREYPYTLDIPTPPAGRDVVDYFLFDLKQGYCDYYATSMVVLARAAGLPARLVAGYANGSYDFEHAQYIVTENYAHSWVEIYFANIGWVEFEPTASQPVIFYEEKNESTALVTEVLPVRWSLGGKIAPFVQNIFRSAWYPALFLLVCGLFWIGYDVLYLSRISPSQTIQLLYKRLRRLAHPIAGITSRDQTAHSYAFILIQNLSALDMPFRLKNWLMPSQQEINQLTELFSCCLFAPSPSTREEANDAIKIWSRLRWRLMLANILRIRNK